MFPRVLMMGVLLWFGNGLCIAEPPEVLKELLSDRPTVLVFLTVECPLARLYARRLETMSQRHPVSFVGIDSSPHDTAADIEKFRRAHLITFPILRDPDQNVARKLAATRTPEAFLLDAAGSVLYRGRIDDQYLPGTNLGAPRKQFLRDAIHSLVEGEPIVVSHTEPVGCLIPFSAMSQPHLNEVTYSRDVAPILFQRCVPCHREGRMGPFSLVNFEDAVQWSSTIAEVIREGRMPPWGASPEHGEFLNDPTLSPIEKKIIFEWIESGMPEGQPQDMPKLPPLPKAGWFIEPDVVLSMEESFAVPAEGSLEYQYFVIDPGLESRKWVRAVQILPGNLAVVHHAGVAIRPRGQPGAESGMFWRIGSLHDTFLAMYLPGQPFFELPDGMAKQIPADSELVLEIHYVPIGKEQKDRTSIGIEWADDDSVAREVATWAAYTTDFQLPPHAADYRVEFEWAAGALLELRALYPHMHLRGKSMTVTALYPSGSTEVLLSVPCYDFSWQHRYEFTSPKIIPQGTRIGVSAVYDNSAANPNNPDPNVVVENGLSTTDEMCQLYLEICRHRDLIDDSIVFTKTSSSWIRTRTRFLGIAVFVAAACGIACAKRRIVPFRSLFPR